MNQTDLRIYSAKLQVSGYYHFEHGKSRDEVAIKWHGDETQNEMEFVTRPLDEAYAWLTSSKFNNIEILPALAFGNMVYQACMVGRQL